MEKKPLTKHPETRGKIISECDNSVTRPFLQSKEIFQKIKRSRRTKIERRGGKKRIKVKLSAIKFIGSNN